MKSVFHMTYYVYVSDFLCWNTDVFQKAGSDLTEMRFFRVKLFLQISDKA